VSAATGAATGAGAGAQTTPTGLPNCPECGSPVLHKRWSEEDFAVCSQLAKPDCLVRWSITTDGHPRHPCPRCSGPMRVAKDGGSRCLRCGHQPGKQLVEPEPPLQNCPACRQLMRAVWSAKKTKWYQFCAGCNAWHDPPGGSLPAEPAGQPCPCGGRQTARWGAAKRMWFLQCGSCNRWQFPSL
jgi:ssDNA-binding Zn-finger/Zn-ribbon topoisomerase 1